MARPTNVRHLGHAKSQSYGSPWRLLSVSPHGYDSSSPRGCACGDGERDPQGDVSYVPRFRFAETLEVRRYGGGRGGTSPTVLPTINCSVAGIAVFAGITLCGSCTICDPRAIAHGRRWLSQLTCSIRCVPSARMTPEGPGGRCEWEPCRQQLASGYETGGSTKARERASRQDDDATRTRLLGSAAGRYAAPTLPRTSGISAA